MQNFLGNFPWQLLVSVAGVIIGILAIVVSIRLARSQRPRRQLSYMTSIIPLVAVRKEVKGRLRIFFDDKPVSNADMVILTLINSGNQPITPQDFVSPVTISFGSQAEILSCDITETVPEDLGALVDVAPKSIVLKPLLLNSEDTVTMKILLTQYEGEPAVRGRVLGIKDIQPTQQHSSDWYTVNEYVFFGAFLVTTGFLMVSLLYFNLGITAAEFPFAVLSVIVVAWFASRVLVRRTR